MEGIDGPIVNHSTLDAQKKDVYKRQFHKSRKVLCLRELLFGWIFHKYRADIHLSG